MTLPSLRSQLIQQLACRIQQIERSRQPKTELLPGELAGTELGGTELAGTGLGGKVLTGTDRQQLPSSAKCSWRSWVGSVLPAGGLSSGTILEWLAPDGAGAGTLALKLVAPLLAQLAPQVQLAQQTAPIRQGVLVVVDGLCEFHPPAVWRLGIPLDRILVVRPRSQNDILWAVEQALRCPGVIATFCRLEKLTDRVFRRLQLAAESGGGIGLFLRAVRFQTQPSWASSRFLVQPQAARSPLARRVHVELLYGRGGVRGGGVELEIDDETGRVSVVSQLASATNLPRAAGA